MPRKQNTTQDAYNNSIAARLRKITREKNITDAALAAAVEVQRQTIGYYKNGDRVPDAYTLGRIASALGVSCDYLIGNSDIAATSPDIKAAADLTGLSSGALEALSKIKKYSLDNELHQIALLNIILEEINNNISAIEKECIQWARSHAEMPGGPDPLEEDIKEAIADEYILSDDILNILYELIYLNGRKVSLHTKSDLLNGYVYFDVENDASGSKAVEVKASEIYKQALYQKLLEGLSKIEI